MNTHGGGFTCTQSPPHTYTSPSPEPPLLHRQFHSTRHLKLSIRARHHSAAADSPSAAQIQASSSRRALLSTSILALGASVLQSAASKAEDVSKPPQASISPPSPPPPPPQEAAAIKIPEAASVDISSRIYDATAIGEPMAVGKDKRKVWEKLMNARIVYLGESEQVPVKDDKELELEIVKNLRKRCVESEKSISVAMEAFPCDFQSRLNEYMDRTIDGEALKAALLHWSPERWIEYEPLLSYCRDNGVKIIACGTPLKVIRTVQAEGIRGLSKAERKLYAPPAGSGFISGFTSISRRSIDINSANQAVPFGPSSYLSAQAKVVDDYTMSQIIMQAVVDGGTTGMIVVVTGASHVLYGSRGTGVPARISKKMQKKNQVVILLDPERQSMRREGEVPAADFLWYSAARPCSRNCYDRAEIARVMNAAGRKRDALPQDLQTGLDLGLVSPEVLQNFFDLEQYPVLKELAHSFQGFRERLLADPKFLHRLAIEESISITTTLVAQYERRKENFFQELDYVITDTARGIVVDFFTVWLPAPTLSFLSYTDVGTSTDSIDTLKGLLVSIPDNAFQKSIAGKDWNLNQRFLSVLFGGLKLSSVGFISSIGAVAASNVLNAVRNIINPALITNQQIKRSPILKTAVVYSCFLGTSANLRYQIIAGLIEHRLSDEFASQTLLVNMVSFLVRIVNSYWGTQQWIDLARYSGLQSKNSKVSSYESEIPAPDAECNTAENATIKEIENPSPVTSMYIFLCSSFNFGKCEST
ncbi:hypothetical protein M5689_002233 [Euphorbia peplus]|nr:hypothetical protein M5689_002233 [Euphorbia peplus]